MFTTNENGNIQNQNYGQVSNMPPPPYPVQTTNVPPPSYTIQSNYPTVAQYGVQTNQVNFIHDQNNAFPVPTRVDNGVSLGKKYLTRNPALLLFGNMVGSLVCIILSQSSESHEQVLFERTNFIISIVKVLSIATFAHLAFFLVSIIMDPRFRCGRPLRVIHMRACRSVAGMAIFFGVASFVLLLHSFEVIAVGTENELESLFNHKHNCSFYEDGCLKLKITGITGTLTGFGMLMQSYLHFVDAQNSRNTTV